MTEMLYLLDCYRKEFEAIVAGTRGDEIELDKTFFYPESGGQPSDLGTILVNGKEVKMIHARKEGEEVWHKIEGEMPSAGDSVGGIIDWTRRYIFMRYHTALHMLSRVLYDEFRAGITGNQIGLDKSRMDFATDMYDKEKISYIEERTNLAIARNYPIKFYMLPRQEAMTVVDQNRTRIDLLPAQIDKIRIVEIVGYDFEACGGTHLSSTGEIGKLRITKIENKGKNNKRMEIVLE
jgi:misacylated tRNA(Ala) deacylase